MTRPRTTYPTNDKAYFHALAQKAEDTAAAARGTREHYRRRTRRSHEFRVNDITRRLDEIKALMPAVRAAVGRLPYEAKLYPGTEAKLRRGSLACQAERRKLRKML